MHGRINCLQVMKDHKANELAVDQDGRTVLHVATLMNQIETVTWHLESYSLQPSNAHRPSRLVQTPERVARRLSSRLCGALDMEGSDALNLAVTADLETMVRLLVESGLEIISKTKSGLTPLHRAVMLNNNDIAALLITSSADVHNTDANSMSPLHWAACLGHRESVALLLANKAGKAKYDDDGDLPKHKAAWFGQLTLFDDLVGERSDLELNTRDGETLLHITCLRCDLVLAHYLLQHVVNVNSWAVLNYSRPTKVQNVAI